jgi:uncharacterized protein YeaO (DUF488 family)
MGTQVLILKTAQMAVGKKQSDMLDITVKTGDKVFAPTWGMVMGYKDGLISESKYTDTYQQIMRQSFKNNRRRWEDVVRSGSVTLVCYCAAGAFCHRHLLAKMLTLVARDMGYEVMMEGEII